MISTIGKLELLHAECDKYGRRGPYQLDRLIERYGIDAKRGRLVGRTHRGLSVQEVRNSNDQCGGRCPDLPKVV